MDLATFCRFIIGINPHRQLFYQLVTTFSPADLCLINSQIRVQRYVSKNGVNTTALATSASRSLAFLFLASTFFPLPFSAAMNRWGTSSHPSPLGVPPLPPVGPLTFLQRDIARTHTHKPDTLPKAGELTLVRLGLNPYSWAWPQVRLTLTICQADSRAARDGIDRVYIRKHNS